MLGSLQTCNNEFASFLRFMTSFMLEGMAQVRMLDACIYGAKCYEVNVFFTMEPYHSPIAFWEFWHVWEEITILCYRLVQSSSIS